MADLSLDARVREARDRVTHELFTIRTSRMAGKLVEADEYERNLADRFADLVRERERLKRIEEAAWRFERFINLLFEGSDHAADPEMRAFRAALAVSSSGEETRDA